MKSAIDAGIPILVFAAMFIVGTDLTKEDFLRVIRHSRVVLAATVGQIILLPLLGCILVHWCNFEPAISQGLLLLTACPSGAMANVYTLVARGNVALSVTLTAVSCLVAVVSMPLTLMVLQGQVAESNSIAVPFGILAGQLLLLLVVPVMAGMALRLRWAGVIRKYRGSLLGFGVAALIALLIIVVLQEAKTFAGAMNSIIAIVGVLTVLAFGAGWMTAWSSGANSKDRFTVGIVFVVRNVGIATAIAVTSLGRMEFAIFATAYFLVQAPIILAGIFLFRLFSQPDHSPILQGINVDE